MTVRTASIAAAVALSGVTLATFGALQNYGPASTLRRFHVAVERNDAADAARVLDLPLEANESRVLVSLVAGLVRRGEPYRIARMERLPREVRAVVAYEGRDGLSRAFVWVIVKEGRTWKIDVRRTATILRDSLGMPASS